MIDIESIRIAAGSHSRPAVVTQDAELCTNEWVAYLASEPHSAHPRCMSRVIAAFTMRWTDAMSDEDRQILRPYLRRVIGTAAGPEIERRRAYLAADWSSRIAVPRWLRVCGLEAEAAELEALLPVADEPSGRLASAALRHVQDVAYTLREKRRAEFEQRLRAARPRGAAGAVWNVWNVWNAGDAGGLWAVWNAGDAGGVWAAVNAGDAGGVWAAVNAAALWAVWNVWAAVNAAALWAVWDVWAAKLKAANAKTYDEVYAIARPYFSALCAEMLRPVVVDLQQSALGLLDRMIECGGDAP